MARGGRVCVCGGGGGGTGFALPRGLLGQHTLRQVHHAPVLRRAVQTGQAQDLVLLHGPHLLLELDHLAPTAIEGDRVLVGPEGLLAEADVRAAALVLDVDGRALRQRLVESSGERGVLDHIAHALLLERRELRAERREGRLRIGRRRLQQRGHARLVLLLGEVEGRPPELVLCHRLAPRAQQQPREGRVVGAPLRRLVQRRLPVLALGRGVGARREEQPHAVRRRALWPRALRREMQRRVVSVLLRQRCRHAGPAGAGERGQGELGGRGVAGRAHRWPGCPPRPRRSAGRAGRPAARTGPRRAARSSASAPRAAAPLRPRPGCPANRPQPKPPNSPRSRAAAGGPWGRPRRRATSRGRAGTRPRACFGQQGAEQLRRTV
eukprot:COSAG04_NODE_493_length_13427_cov_20.233118_9_plen_380_part_00